MLRIGDEKYVSTEHLEIISEYKGFIENQEFPCIAAKAALGRQQIKYKVVSHIGCPKDDLSILDFLYEFISSYRKSSELYHSAAVIFQQPVSITEAMFEEWLWQRLQSLSDLDSKKFSHDKRVQSDPLSPDFSFSLGEEAFFLVGLHPASSRIARRFKYPAIIFNPHLQFEQLRETEKYKNIQYAVRKRDVALSGSVNPMLNDFGKSSEVFQYSGRKYDNNWQCPLKINHG